MVLLKILFIVALIYGLIGFFVNTKTAKIPLSKGSFFIGLIGFLLLSTIVRIGAQEVGVVVTPGGVRNEEIHTGWHIIMPWCDVHKMDKTVWVYTCAQSSKEGNKANQDAIWAPTKDGIKMGLDVSVSWRITPSEASWIYQNVTENDGGNSGRYIWLEENVIRAKLKSSLALVVSNYNPIEVYSNKRQEIQDEVKAKLAKEVSIYFLIIDNVDIREVYYNKEYETAINQKKLAEQEALRLVEVTKQKTEQLKQAEIDKNIAIQKAEGEAKALQIKGTSINQNPKIIQLEWIDKWDGKLPTYMLSDKNGLLLNISQE